MLSGQLYKWQIPAYSPELNRGEGVWHEVKSQRVSRAGIFFFAEVKSKALEASLFAEPS